MFRPRFALAAALVALAAVAPARAADPGAAQVLTPDARGFLHVRVSDVWDADVAKQLRAFAGQAGPNLLAEFDSKFYPAPSDVESFTVVLFEPNFRDPLPIGRPSDKTPVWVVTSKKPLDREQLFKTLAKGGRTRKHGNKEYQFDESHWAALLVLDDRSYAYASEDSVTALIDRMAKGGASPLAATFVRETGKHPVTLGVNVAGMANPNALKGVPAELQPLFKAKTLLAALDLKPKTTATATLEFATEAEAKDGAKAAQEAVQLARGQIGIGLLFVEQKAKADPAKPPAGIQAFPEQVGYLLAVAGLKQLDALLGSMPLAAKGTTVQAALELDGLLPGGSTAISIAAVATAVGVGIAGAEPRGVIPNPCESLP